MAAGLFFSTTVGVVQILSDAGCILFINQVLQLHAVLRLGEQDYPHTVWVQKYA